MPRILLRIVLVLVLASLLRAAAAEEEYRPPSFEIDDFLMRTLPGALFYPTFIENLAPDATFLIEESNGFALLDRPRVYFEGDSALDFRWSLGRFPINSALHGGAPALLPPFSSLSGFRLQGETPLDNRSGFSFLPLAPGEKQSRLTLSAILPNLGGVIPLPGWLGVNTASQRQGLFSQTRRKLVGNAFADSAWQSQGRRSSLLVAAGYYSQERQFNDLHSPDATFTENGEALLFFSRYQRNVGRGTLEVNLAANRQLRDNEGAELGRYPEETDRGDRGALFAGLGYSRPHWQANLSFLLEKEKLSPVAANFPKDLKDIDGEGFSPCERTGVFSAGRCDFSLNRSWAWKLAGAALEARLFADASTTRVTGKEQEASLHPLLDDGAPYRVLWLDAGSPFHHWRSALSPGAMLRYSLGAHSSLLAKFFFSYQSLAFEQNANNLHFFSQGFDLGWSAGQGRRLSLLLAYGRLPEELGPEVSFFLERSTPSGTIYRWLDANGDGVFQNGEQGEVVGYSGGRFHVRDPQLRLPTRERLLLQLGWRFSPRWQLEMKGILKRQHHPFWVFPGGNYGFWENVNGRDFFFFDRPIDQYVLGNATFSQKPFYGELQFRVSGGRPERWFLSFSLMAHIGMGYTAFGDGPGANDTGILAESQADPNAWGNGYGRLDGDRAFVAKLFFWRRLARNLFLGGSLKYRDGDPFAFMGLLRRNGQTIVYYETIKGEDAQGRKGGPREDFPR